LIAHDLDLIFALSDLLLKLYEGDDVRAEFVEDFADAAGGHGAQSNAYFYQDIIHSLVQFVAHLQRC
jgi:hypothetical protein